MGKVLSIESADKIVKNLKELYSENNSRPCDDVDTWFHFNELSLSVVDKQKVEYENRKMKDDDYEILVHNANHFRLATPSRRMMKDFGLGKPPTFEKYYPKSPLLISKEEAKVEEDLVCTLDLIYAVEGDYSLELIKPNMLSVHIQILFQWGLIDENGNSLSKALRKEKDRLPKELYK